VREGFLAVQLELSSEPSLEQLEQELIRTRYYDYVRVGYDRRRIELLPRCRIGGGAGRLEQVWRLLEQDGRPTLVIDGEEGVICKLHRRDGGVWHGRWLTYEGMPIELTPTSAEPPTLTDTATDVAHEPIDAVYTWVDGADSAFQQTMRRYAALEPASRSLDQVVAYRYRDSDELRFSLRSLVAYAPWIRHIYLVTNGQTPRWLDTTQSGLTVISHDAIFPDREHLPTFNSHAIELHLHRIPGLARRFLYLNDDVFVGRPISPTDFLGLAGAQCIYLECWQLPTTLYAGAVHDRAYAYTQGLLDMRLAPRSPRPAIAHTPQMYDRDLIAEVQQVWAKQVTETSAHRFRSPRDVAFRILYYYYALESEQHRAHHAPITLYDHSTDYIFLRLRDRTPKMIHMLDDLLFQRPKFFCLNDELDDSDEAGIILSWLKACLREYYPQPSKFELDLNCE